MAKSFSGISLESQIFSSKLLLVIFNDFLEQTLAPYLDFQVIRPRLLEQLLHIIEMAHQPPSSGLGSRSLDQPLS